MRIARSTGAVSGLLVGLLGIWGALIPFVGPYLNYSFSPNVAWHYTTDRLWLCVLPGAGALLAGIVLALAATRAACVLGGWLGLMAGAWFLIGPTVSLTWEHGPGPIGRALFWPTRQMLELVGYFYGLGALIVALSAFVLGRLVPARALAQIPATAEGAPARIPIEPPAPAAAHQTAAPRRPVRSRVRVLFRRRQHTRS